MQHSDEMNPWRYGLLVSWFSMGSTACLKKSPESQSDSVVEVTPVEPLEWDLSLKPVLLREEGDNFGEEPRTRVVLSVSSELGAPTLIEVDEVMGTCSLIEESHLLQCWWAGAGADFSLRHDGTQWLVERQYTDEQVEPGGLPVEVIYRLDVAEDGAVRPTRR